MRARLDATNSAEVESCEWRSLHDGVWSVFGSAASYFGARCSRAVQDFDTIRPRGGNLHGADAYQISKHDCRAKDETPRQVFENIWTPQLETFRPDTTSTHQYGFLILRNRMVEAGTRLLRLIWCISGQRTRWPRLSSLYELESSPTGISSPRNGCIGRFGASVVLSSNDVAQRLTERPKPGVSDGSQSFQPPPFGAWAMVCFHVNSGVVKCLRSPNRLVSLRNA